MAEVEDHEAAVMRLEAALDRIARAAASGQEAGLNSEPPEGADRPPGTQLITARLDALIARLRAVLDPAP